MSDHTPSLRRGENQPQLFARDAKFKKWVKDTCCDGADLFPDANGKQTDLLRELQHRAQLAYIEELETQQKQGY